MATAQAGVTQRIMSSMPKRIWIIAACCVVWVIGALGIGYQMVGDVRVGSEDGPSWFLQCEKDAVAGNDMQKLRYCYDENHRRGVARTTLRRSLERDVWTKTFFTAFVPPVITMVVVGWLARRRRFSS